MSLLRLRIAGLGISLQTEEMTEADREFAPFLSQARPETSIIYSQVPELPSRNGPVISMPAFDLYRIDGDFVRDYRVKDRQIICRMVNGGIRAEYLARETEGFSIRDYFSFVPLEELLLNHGRMILHASCVETEQGGVLFSGPSGIGKSTQADLWHQYRGAEILNGDRVILYRSASGWVACGSPYAGSSRCYVNRCIPIRAIVMLERGSGNDLTPLSPPEAFRLVYAQLLINTWNPRFVAQVCDLCQTLIEEIPVVRFSCTPDQTAVQALDAWLKGGGADG